MHLHPTAPTLIYHLLISNLLLQRIPQYLTILEYGTICHIEAFLLLLTEGVRGHELQVLGLGHARTESLMLGLMVDTGDLAELLLLHGLIIVTSKGKLHIGLLLVAHDILLGGESWLAAST